MNSLTRPGLEETSGITQRSRRQEHDGTRRASDWEIPNCRAIRDGLTPAFVVLRSRTMISFPCRSGFSVFSPIKARSTGMSALPSKTPELVADIEIDAFAHDQHAVAVRLDGLPGLAFHRKGRAAPGTAILLERASLRPR